MRCSACFALPQASTFCRHCQRRWSFFQWPGFPLQKPAFHCHGDWKAFYQICTKFLKIVVSQHLYLWFCVLLLVCWMKTLYKTIFPRCCSFLKQKLCHPGIFVRIAHSIGVLSRSPPELDPLKSRDAGQKKGGERLIPDIQDDFHHPTLMPRFYFRNFFHNPITKFSPQPRAIFILMTKFTYEKENSKIIFFGYQAHHYWRYCEKMFGAVFVNCCWLSLFSYQIFD